MKFANFAFTFIFMALPIYSLPKAEGGRSAEYDDTGNLCDNCVEARDCPVIATALNVRPRSTDFFRLLKRIKCGSNGNKALICCDLITDKVLEVFFGNQGLNSKQKRRNHIGRGHQFAQTNGPFSVQLGNPILDNEFKEFNDEDSKPNKLNGDECGMSLVNRIVGGQDALLGQFPWMAQLGYRGVSSETRYRCGGALVTARHVLTAAHCLVKLPPFTRLVTVRLGEPQKDFAPLQRIAHEDYDRPRLQNDIALLKINDTVSFTQYLRPICVPFAGRAVDLNTVEQNSLVVAGWGFTTSAGSRAHSETLRWTKMSYLEQEKCESIYKVNFKLDVGKSQLCTKPVLNVDACGGDSGGPLFWEGEGGAAVLVGLVSFGPRRCGAPTIPGVYTDVAAYGHWIERTLDALEAS